MITGNRTAQTRGGRLSLPLAIVSGGMLACIFTLASLAMRWDEETMGLALVFLPVMWMGTLIGLLALLFGFAGLIQRRGNRLYAALGTVVSVAVLVSAFYWWYWPGIEFSAYCNHDYASEIPGCVDQFDPDIEKRLEAEQHRPMQRVPN